MLSATPSSRLGAIRYSWTKRPASLPAGPSWTRHSYRQTGLVTSSVVTKLDRLGRSLDHLISLSKDLQVADVDLVVLDQGIDTSTAIGRMFFRILGAIAEHALMSERTLDGLAATRARGRTVGQKPTTRLWPIGPEIVPERRCRVIKVHGAARHPHLAAAREERPGSRARCRLLPRSMNQVPWRALLREAIQGILVALTSSAVTSPLVPAMKS